MELFDRTKKTVKEIYDAYTAQPERLIVDSSYQRRRVWLLQDKVRLIETILLGSIVPEVFFWPATIDPETGSSVTHIVDGQQRIDAIIGYIMGEYKLASRYLLEEEIKESHGNKFFAELSPDAKTAIWTYKLSVVDIDKSWSKQQITNMFYRLNLTNYSLNDQEKRNSRQSAFGDKAEALATHDFWKQYKIFSANDARRMNDTTYCCSIFILADAGVVDQTDKRTINDYYDDYVDSFDSDDRLLNKIYQAMEIIERFSDASTIGFLSKKAQMFTMFCIAFRLIDDGLAVNDELFQKVKLYINAYNLFRNGADIQIDDPEVDVIFDSIKKYKLASSEGINKYQNRMIRYEQLYKVCVCGKPEIVAHLQQLVEALNSNRMSQITVREEVEIEEEE